jgi:NAD(P)-dependent dehydrogenase (short-subunit alcohol dehydrogenase family)
VNNAGISPWVGMTAECSVESWQQVISINLTGTWMGMKYQIPALLKNGGAIVNMSSVAALSTFAGYCPYSASKWGIVGITRVAAREYAGSGIRVNAIAPGAIDTPLFADVVASTPNSREDDEAAAPMKRVAGPAEVATAATWLCSEGASYVTGILVPVEGGSTYGMVAASPAVRGRWPRPGPALRSALVTSALTYSYATHALPSRRSSSGRFVV